MKKRTKKLTLHRETVLSLQHGSLVKGGTEPPTGYPQPMYTGCACYEATEYSYCEGFVSVCAC